MTFQFVGSSRLHVARGMTGATGHLYVGLHEFEDTSEFTHQTVALILVGVCSCAING